MPRPTRKRRTNDPMQGRSNRQGGGGKVARGASPEKKMLINDEQSRNVYENKEKDDTLSAAKDDISAQLHAISMTFYTEANVFCRNRRLFCHVFECWGTNRSLQNVETSIRGHPVRAFPVGAGRSRASGRDAHATSFLCPYRRVGARHFCIVHPRGPNLLGMSIPSQTKAVIKSATASAFADYCASINSTRQVVHGSPIIWKSLRGLRSGPRRNP